MKINKEQPHILVVGSCSIDLVLGVEKPVEEGETVMASYFENFYGGKGANQSVGTARLGASVYFIGCVGMDPFGQQILRYLVSEGVNVGFVAESEEEPTGTAYVTSSEGKNRIVVVPAANFRLNPRDIESAERLFHTADLVLIQLESPMSVVKKTCELAKKHNKKIGIYAAPAMRLPEEVIEYASFIVAKTNDVFSIFGKKEEEVLSQLANKLFIRDRKNITVYHNGKERVTHDGGLGSVVHAMGMGDAFTSGFAVALCHGNSVEDCVRLGSEAALKVSGQRGSQRGLPTLKTLGYR